MSPANEKAKSAFLAWIVPALLAAIVALIVLGGGAAISVMQRQADDIAGIRSDFQKSQLLMESRVTRLEDAMSKRPLEDADDQHKETPLLKPKYYMRKGKP